MIGEIKAISISRDKGTKKKNVAAAMLKENYGIVDDAHAGSQRQVSFLAEESIEKMKTKGLNIGPGDFAENITTKGINLSNLKIGARMKIGEESLLEVTRRGKECHAKCDIYYQVGHCLMPKEGIFARVIRGGVIKPGDRLEILENV